MRSRSQFLSLLLAAAFGIALGFAEVYVLGFMAARPYPHWYLLALQDHKHLRYELWGVVGMAAPVALLAAAFGRRRCADSEIGHRLGLSKNAVLDIVKRDRAAMSGGIEVAFSIRILK